MLCSNLLVEEAEVCIGSSTPEGQPPPVQVIVSLKITTEAAECVAVVLSSENSVLNLGVVCPSLSSLLLFACLTLPVAGVRSPVYNVCLICVGAVCHSVCFCPQQRALLCVYCIMWERNEGFFREIFNRFSQGI